MHRGCLQHRELPAGTLGNSKTHLSLRKQKERLAVGQVALFYCKNFNSPAGRGPWQEDTAGSIVLAL
jgi:hypothetical protein